MVTRLPDREAVSIRCACESATFPIALRKPSNRTLLQNEIAKRRIDALKAFLEKKKFLHNLLLSCNITSDGIAQNSANIVTVGSPLEGPQQFIILLWNMQKPAVFSNSALLIGIGVRN